MNNDIELGAPDAGDELRLFAGPAMPHLEFQSLDSGIAAHNRISGAICLLPGTDAERDTIAEEISADPIFSEQALAGLEDAGLFNKTRHAFPVPVKFSKAEEHVSLFCAFGAEVVHLQCPEPEVLDVFRSVLDPILVDAAETAVSDTIAVQYHGDSFGVFVNARPVYGQCEFSLARHFTMREIATSLAGRQQVSATFHAGAIGTRERAVVFAAGSGSGKSTLTASMAAKGFVYYCDDQCALVDTDGCISAFPTKVGLKSGSWEVSDLGDYRIDEIEPTFAGDGYIKQVTPRVIADPADRPEVAAFVFPAYGEDAEFALAEISKLDALQRLFNSGARLAGRYPTIRPLARALDKTPAYHLTYNNTVQAMEAVARLLEE